MGFACDFSDNDLGTLRTVRLIGGPLKAIPQKLKLKAMNFF